MVAEGGTFKVLLASLTYFKAEPGDQITIVVPKDREASWGAVENVIKKGSIKEPTDGVSRSDGQSEETEMDEV